MPGLTTAPPGLACEICGGICSHSFSVDFNKSCEERYGRFLPSAGIAIEYVTCNKCGFCFAPELHSWSPEEFASRIYNDEYTIVDPDYLERRPRAFADHLVSRLGDAGRGITHLDYGGGHGLLSDMLRDSGWNSTSYDPFVDREARLPELGRFDLVTAYEVFEHVSDVRMLARNLRALIKDDGIIHFSTMLSDGKLADQPRGSWWYASPRNGHISLFSRDALFYLAHNEGLNVTNISPNLHVLWRVMPAWASHMLG
jgi:SAM-dependent methyltransferase